MTDGGLERKRLWYVYVAMVLVSVPAWHLLFGATRLPRSAAEHLYRLAFVGLYAVAGSGLLWLEVRSKLAEVDEREVRSQ